MAVKKNTTFKLKYTTESNIYTENIKYVMPEILNDVYNDYQLLDTYVNIGNLSGNKSLIEFYVDVYPNSEKNILLSSTKYSFVPSVDDASPNFIKQAYEYLKTLDEYKDAIDC